jgi:hypothetical protein
MTASRLKPCDHVQLLPARHIAFTGTNAQGWGHGSVAAGRMEHRGRPMVVWAGMNIMRIPTFCGANIIGCVNTGMTLMEPNSVNERLAANLPVIEPVSERLKALATKHEITHDYIVPILSIFHFLIGYGHMQTKAAMFLAFDRTRGYTYRNTLFAATALRNRLCMTESYATQPYPVPYIKSVTKMRPYMNLNSNASVGGVGIRVGRDNEAEKYRTANRNTGMLTSKLPVQANWRNEWMQTQAGTFGEGMQAPLFLGRTAFMPM